MYAVCVQSVMYAVCVIRTVFLFLIPKEWGIEGVWGRQRLDVWAPLRCDETSLVDEVEGEHDHLVRHAFVYVCVYSQ